MEEQSKSREFISNDYSAVNSAIDNIVIRDGISVKIKNAQLQNIRTKNAAIILIALCVACLLLVIAYTIYKQRWNNEVNNVEITKESSSKIMENKKPLEIDKSIIPGVPNYSFSEKSGDTSNENSVVGSDGQSEDTSSRNSVFPSIDNTTKENVIKNYVLFHEVEVKSNNIAKVVTGAEYSSVMSKKPYKQYCYALIAKEAGYAPFNNVAQIIDLGDKKESEKVDWVKLTTKDEEQSGANISFLEDLKNKCQFD